MLPSLPLACQASALLVSYTPNLKMERVNGIAPLSRPWHGRILLLNHTRLKFSIFAAADQSAQRIILPINS